MSSVIPQDREHRRRLTFRGTAEDAKFCSDTLRVRSIWWPGSWRQGIQPLELRSKVRGWGMDVGVVSTCVK